MRTLLPAASPGISIYSFVVKTQLQTCIVIQYIVRLHSLQQHNYFTGMSMYKCMLVYIVELLLLHVARHGIMCGRDVVVLK